MFLMLTAIAFTQFFLPEEANIEAPRISPQQIAFEELQLPRLDPPSPTIQSLDTPSPAELPLKFTFGQGMKDTVIEIQATYRGNISIEGKDYDFHDLNRALAPWFSISGCIIKQSDSGAAIIVGAEIPGEIVIDQRWEGVLVIGGEYYSMDLIRTLLGK